MVVSSIVVAIFSLFAYSVAARATVVLLFHIPMRWMTSFWIRLGLGGFSRRLLNGLFRYEYLARRRRQQKTEAIIQMHRTAAEELNERALRFEAQRLD